MAFCKNCGNALKDGAKFCGKCGAKVEIPVEEAPVNEAPVYEAPVKEAPVVIPAAPTYNVNFTVNKTESTWDGGVFETILNSIAASLIIMFTCGIATPWAICYIMKFVISHAVIDGKRMTFDGTGGQLFGNWIKWFLLTIVTCGIYSFWVTPRMYKWVASHIHAEN